MATTKKKPVPSPEAVALRQAIQAGGGAGAQKNLAAHLGLDPSVVSQWVTGFRPVPAGKAAAVAKYLGIAPEAISKSYRTVVVVEPRMVSEPAAGYATGHRGVAREQDLAFISDQVAALTNAFAVAANVMVRHRPAEAADVAQALQKHIPPALRETAPIQELLKAFAPAEARRDRAKPA